MNASKERFGADDLQALFDGAKRVLVAKGKKTLTFDMSAASSTDEEFVAVVLGPTGNLRAPSLRMGKTWIVGFQEETYGELFD